MESVSQRDASDEAPSELDRLRAENAELKEMAGAVANANAMAAELIVEVEEAREALDESMQKLRSITDNVEFGFFMVDQTLHIASEVTKSCMDLFGTDDVAERALDEVLKLSETVSAQLRLSVDEVFCDILPEELSCAQIPCRFEVDDKVLHMSARARRDEDGDVANLLFSVLDISQLESEQKENENNRALLRILRDKAAFQNYLAEVRGDLARAEQSIEEGDQQIARRLVHTVKGNSAIFGLTQVAKQAHHVEDAAELTREGVLAIADSVKDFLDTHREVLDISWQGGQEARKVEIDHSELAVLNEALLDGDLAKMRNWIDYVQWPQAHQIWGPIAEQVCEVAERAGKKVSFQVTGSDLRVPPESVEPVLRAIHHLVRNAVVHGIEFPDARAAKGEAGSIRLELVRRDYDFVIEVQDDGAGIDCDALGARCVDKGIMSSDELAELSCQERLALVFVDGLSTCSDVDTDAGRGVGMPAIREAVQHAGGRIDIESNPGRGTCFRITIPAGGRT